MSNISFEQSLERLEKIVKELEQGEAPLDQALELFDEGVRLIRDCGKKLDAAEQKVKKLVKGPDGEPQETKFTEA